MHNRGAGFWYMQGWIAVISRSVARLNQRGDGAAPVDPHSSSRSAFVCWAMNIGLHDKAARLRLQRFVRDRHNSSPACREVATRSATTTADAGRFLKTSQCRLRLEEFLSPQVRRVRRLATSAHRQPFQCLVAPVHSRTP